MSQTILETSRNLLDVFLLDELGICVNCICPGWVKTPALQRELVGMTQDERAALGYPPPVLIQPNEIADPVIMFVRDDALAGRVVIWPDGEPWRPVPVTGIAG